MSEPVSEPASAQHRADAAMLRSRAARPGEPAVGHGRWWPHETWKYADLLEEGQPLTSYERWLAGRELERRERREHMPAIVRGRDARFEPTRWPGVSVAYLVAPHLDLEAPSHTIELLRLEPGASTALLTENESVLHVLAGTGRSVIFGESHHWGLHDSIHIAEGAPYQHINDGTEVATLVVGRVTPLVEHLYTMATIYKGDSFSDLPDDYHPEHPFTHERVTVGYVDGEKWMSHMQSSQHHARDERAARTRVARKVLRADEAVVERSHHKGDWKVGLVDAFFGFANIIMGMYVHQLPPSAHTETHKHGWDTIYVLSGHGYSIVNGVRHDWEPGDVINVPAGAWHQHFNTSETEVSQHLLISPDPLRLLIHPTGGSVQEEAAS
jgi:quercetin dioxygenase-like cupin family protein